MLIPKGNKALKWSAIWCLLLSLAYCSRIYSESISENSAEKISNNSSKDSAKDSAKETSEKSEVVIVTGTRAQSRTLDESTVALEVLSKKQLSLQPHGDLTENLKNLVPSYSATPLTGDGSAFVRSTSLRGLPPDEVMILFNSQRRHRSALIHHLGASINQGAHAADIGPIPAIALKRVEVLKDGASSQYGSDAIAGVINFILKDDDQGGSIEAQYGRFFLGETSTKISTNLGWSLFEQGFANISAEYTDDQQLHRGFQPIDAQAALDAGIENVGTDSPFSGDTLAQTWGRPKSNGIRTAWNFGSPIDDHNSWYAFGNYADVIGTFRFFYRAPSISGDPNENHPTLRPFPLDPTDPSLGNFCWCNLLPGGYTPYLKANVKDLSYVTGLRGLIRERWFYNVSASHGESTIEYHLFNTLNPTYGPNSQRNFHPGDLKNSESMINVDMTHEVSDFTDLYFGVEWREEVYQFYAGDEQSWMPGPWAQVGDLIDPETGNPYSYPPNGSNGLPGLPISSAGKFGRSNWAVYSDWEAEMSNQWLIHWALRYEDFSDFGSTINGKLSSRFDISEQIRVRAAVSTGFRAPTPGQSNLETIVTTFDTQTGLQTDEGTLRPTDPLLVPLGGQALDSEKSRNFSVGLSMPISDYFKMSIDTYRIIVSDRIVKTFDIDVSNNPAFLNSNFSSVAFYTNGLKTKTQGIDIILEGSFHWDSGDKTELSFALNHNETSIVQQNQVNGVNPVTETTIFNIENGLPKNRLNLMISHRQDALEYRLRFNWYDETYDERNNREKVRAKLFTDFEIRYQATDALNFKLGSTNLFDQYPNQIQSRMANGLPYPRRSPMGYDGGMWYLKLEYEF